MVLGTLLGIFVWSDGFVLGERVGNDEGFPVGTDVSELGSKV